MGTYARVAITAAEELLRDGISHYALFLPRPSDHLPVLYREAGAGLAQPDFDRLRAHGVPFLYMLDKDLDQCASILESRLARLLASPKVAPEEKARLVHQVGTSVARDLTRGPIVSDGLERVACVMDNVIGSVLRDPAIAANMLVMASHERSTASHMFVVSALAIMLGAEVFGSDYEMLRSLGLAGMMHDLGKLAISQEILNSPSPLTPDQMQLIHQHPIESVRLLGDDPLVSPAVRQMILQHHERLDGKGYPLGTCGNELLPGSRILSIVDSFHAMVGKRTYRRPLTPHDANRALSVQAGRQFDADMLDRWTELFNRCCVLGEPLPRALPELEADEASSRYEHCPPGNRRTVYGARPRRYSCNAKIMVRCIYAGRLYDATCAPDEFLASVHDVSPSGLCIFTAHPMYRGEVVHVEVKTGSEVTWVRGTVAWCRQHEQAIYKTGLKFVQRISQCEAQAQVAVCGVDGSGTPVTDDTRNRLAEGGSMNAPGPTPPDKVEIRETLNHLERISALRTATLTDEKIGVAAASSPDAGVRNRTIDVLAKIGTKAARMALMTLLKDSDPEIREHAVGTAGTMRMHEAAHLLRERLADPVDAVALRAAGALGLLGEQTGLPLVARALMRDDAMARLAAKAFGEIVGHRFPANANGIQSARTYLEAKRSALKVV
jgi:HD-GYP domain-containing protein (c-di-GMP phosphodiesterase class II)